MVSATFVRDCIISCWALSTSATMAALSRCSKANCSVSFLVLVVTSWFSSSNSATLSCSLSLTVSSWSRPALSCAKWLVNNRRSSKICCCITRSSSCNCETMSPCVEESAMRRSAFSSCKRTAPSSSRCTRMSCSAACFPTSAADQASTATIATCNTRGSDVSLAIHVGTSSGLRFLGISSGGRFPIPSTAGRDLNDTSSFPSAVAEKVRSIWLGSIVPGCGAVTSDWGDTGIISGCCSTDTGACGGSRGVN
mmetsp:Transcript_14709/g.35654  ORF Transcript_14709/g.35654 Transcript_14709/m.35654 type:complete len:252 (+) Transcript_14709:844-1599(+)